MRWHFLFESLAYIVAFRLYLRQRDAAGDFLETATRWNVIAAAVVGAAVGSKLLCFLEDPFHHYLWTGKTIIGGLAGGTLAVELVKWRTGIRRRTGDLFAIPLAIGIAIGRIGCLFAGTQDDTYGIPTALPWGIDLGDGVHRHPVQFYEILAMLALAFFLARVRPPRFAEGDRFRLFVLVYYGFRLLVDFLKPGVRFGGLTSLQWVCAAGLLWYARDLWRILTAAPATEAVVHG